MGRLAHMLPPQSQWKREARRGGRTLVVPCSCTLARESVRECSCPCSSTRPCTLDYAAYMHAATCRRSRNPSCCHPSCSLPSRHMQFHLHLAFSRLPLVQK